MFPSLDDAAKDKLNKNVSSNRLDEDETVYRVNLVS